MDEIMIYMPLMRFYKNVDAEMCEWIADLSNVSGEHPFRHLMNEFARTVHDLMLAGF
jgi:hypothetical protein